MTGTLRQFLSAGRKAGATAGIGAFVLFGIIPGIYFGSYASLSLLSTLFGGSVTSGSGVLVRIVMAAGMTVAVMSIGALLVVAGSLAGTAIAYLAYHLRRLVSPDVEPEEAARPVVIGRKPRHTAEDLRSVRSRLSFLDARADDIHSIILIGSAAHGTRKHTSDTDVVIICRQSGYGAFREFLFSREIEEQAAGRAPEFEFSVLSPRLAATEFSRSSPFAHAMKNGLVVRDDGYFSHLVSSIPLSVPGRASSFAALYQGIVSQYYGVMTCLERELRRRGCSAECCRENRTCAGLPSAEVLGRVVMRMLYIVLPAQGYIPLSKRDVTAYAREWYGGGVEDALHIAYRLQRGEISALRYSEYRVLKPLASRLFRETLKTVGTTKEVVRMLTDAAKLVRGDFHAIDDELLKKCVV